MLPNGVKVYIENGIITKGPKDLINKKLSDIIGTEFHPSDAPMTWVDAPTFYPQTHTKGHDKRHIKHAKEMGVTFKEWLNEAAELLNSRDNGTIKWECKGKYYGLDKQNNKIAVGNKEGGIYTYFIFAKNKMRYYIPDEVVAYHHLK